MMIDTMELHLGVEMLVVVQDARREMLFCRPDIDTCFIVRLFSDIHSKSIIKFPKSSTT